MLESHPFEEDKVNVNMIMTIPIRIWLFHNIISFQIELPDTIS